MPNIKRSIKLSCILIYFVAKLIFTLPIKATKKFTTEFYQ